MIILNKSEIEALIDRSTIAPAIKSAFVATRQGQVELPPVGHITFPDHNADCHIKYGHMRHQDNFVIKVATGFPGNADLGMPTGNGMVLVLSAITGALQAVLHDEMRLTDVRTGIAGALASQALARPKARRVLVLGTGPQTVEQVLAHRAILGDQTEFSIWGRSAERATACAAALGASTAPDLQAAVSQADIIVTATGAKTPLFPADWVMPGTHITAVGADAPGKQELDIALVARADRLVVDLVTQCAHHGEVSHAIATGMVHPNTLVELGAIFAGEAPGRQSTSDITIADLTGIAAQDIAIAQCILAAHHS